MLIDSIGAEGVVFSHGDTGNSSLSMNNVVLTDTTLAGVAAFATGSGEFDVVLDTSTIDTMADVTGVTLNGGANANRIDVTFDTLNVATEDAKALELFFDLNAGGADQVRLLAEGSSFTNNTTADALPTAEFDVQGETSFNATVLSSTFTNSGSAGTNNRQFRIDGDGANVAVRLDLNGSPPNGLPNNSNGNFALNQINGTFGLVDRDDTLNDLNNAGNVDETGTIADDPGGLPLP